MRNLINYQTISGDEIFLEVTPNRILNLPYGETDDAQTIIEAKKLFRGRFGSNENLLGSILPEGDKASKNLGESTGKIFKATQGSIEKSLDSILSIGEKINSTMKKLSPQKIEVEFGVSFTVESGVIITSVAARQTQD